MYALLVVIVVILVIVEPMVIVGPMVWISQPLGFTIPATELGFGTDSAHLGGGAATGGWCLQTVVKFLEKKTLIFRPLSEPGLVVPASPSVCHPTPPNHQLKITLNNFKQPEPFLTTLKHSKPAESTLNRPKPPQTIRNQFKPHQMS